LDLELAGSGNAVKTMCQRVISSSAEPAHPATGCERVLRKSGAVYWTITVPWSMFIPQANAMSPDFAGVNSTNTGSFSGNAFLIFNEGNTTSVPHVWSVVRTNVRRASTPARSGTFAGSYPFSITTILAVCMAWLPYSRFENGAT